MKTYNFNVQEELVMINDPILGVKYELQNVITLEVKTTASQENNTIKLENKCRHPKSATLEIGNRILCVGCNEYLMTSNKTS